VPGHFFEQESRPKRCDFSKPVRCVRGGVEPGGLDGQRYAGVQGRCNVPGNRYIYGGASVQTVIPAPASWLMRSPVITPAFRRGVRPPNAGLKFPAEVLTVEEISRLLDACSRRAPTGVRNRAMIVVMWRGGLRCAEALALDLRDVDRERGTLTVRHGKGNRRRVVGLDPTAFAVVERWIDVRAQLGVPRGAALFCTITRGASFGRRVGAGYWRTAIKRLADKAEIDKRVHSHGLRHTHAVELLLEGVPLTVIMHQLGHSGLGVTQRYVDHLLPADVVNAMQARAWPDAAAA
jgi:site-specific recombinase XerD